MERPTIALCVVALLLFAPAIGANTASDALLARAANEFYNLDREQALNTYREAVAADPQSPAAYRGLASALWLSITFRRGNMTIDDFLGQITRRDVKLAPPPADVAAAFNDAIDKALALSRKRLGSNANDIDAEYEVGAAVGLRASYIASVEGRLVGAFRAAREAYDAHAHVLKLNPARNDAALIVGTYRYLVAGLGLPMRFVAYLAGFNGGKEMGIKLVESAAAYPGLNRTDARVALVLMYNRERRYDDALTQLAQLRADYPRNRLLWLESGSTSLRAGKAANAERFLSDGIARLSSDARPRMFGEHALWYYKRGAARAALGRTAEARTDLKGAIESEGRDWVHGRAHLELGKLALKEGNKAAAATDLRAALSLCEGSDPAFAEEAKRLLQ